MYLQRTCLQFLLERVEGVEAHSAGRNHAAELGHDASVELRCAVGLGNADEGIPQPVVHSRLQREGTHASNAEHCIHDQYGLYCILCNSNVPCA